MFYYIVIINYISVSQEAYKMWYDESETFEISGQCAHNITH